MQKVVYLTHQDQKIPENALTDKKIELTSFKEGWETFLFLIENPEVQLFIYQLNSDTQINKKLFSTLYQLNPVLPLIVIGDRADEKNYIECNKNINFANSFEQLAEITKDLQEMKRRYYRTQWPLKVKLLNEIDTPLETELLTLSAGGGYIKLSDLSQVKENSPLTLDIHFHDFSFIANARLVKLYPEGQGQLPVGFSIEFTEVTEETQKYIEKVISDKIISNINEVFKES